MWEVLSDLRPEGRMDFNELKGVVRGLLGERKSHRRNVCKRLIEGMYAKAPRQEKQGTFRKVKVARGW